jgi:hypothetical protein
MLEQLLFFETLRTAAAGLRAVERVDACDDLDRVELRVTDFLPGFLPGSENQPWVVEARRVHDFVHPLFGDRHACIALSLPLLVIQPHRPGYLEQVAAHAAPCLDHQRFCLGASVTWDPDTGQLAIYSQLRLWDQPQSVLIAELAERLRAVVALAYLTSFRVWQLQLRRQVPDQVSDPIVGKAHQQMLELLGAAPPPG